MEEDSPIRWKEISSFVVEFALRSEPHGKHRSYRTIIHHVEGSRTADWEGLATLEAAQWMEQRLAAVVPVRREILDPESLASSLVMHLEVKGVHGLGANAERSSLNSQFLGVFVEKESIGIKVVLDLPVLPDLGTKKNDPLVGVYIQARSRGEGEHTSLVSFEAPGLIGDETTIEYEFDDLHVPTGFHEIYGMAVLYLDQPLMAVTHAQFVRVV